MDIKEVFADQLETTKRITEESVDSLLEARHETAKKFGFEDPRTDDEIRETWPIGDKALYALVDRPVEEGEEQEVLESTGSVFDQTTQPLTSRVIEVVRVLESELEQFSEDHILTHRAGDNPGTQLPRFVKK